MRNTSFTFKKFTVNQDACAMKVCTDACLFGARTANEIESEKLNVKSILDIGTGTGLLSLILAQKTSAVIDAVEADEAAAKQARENFDLSPWNDRLQLHHITIQQYNASTFQQSNYYDLIISNPPFFQNSLQSENKQKNAAKHTVQLSYNELAAAVSKNLHADGNFFILLPYSEFESFVQVALQHNLFLHKRLNIQQTPAHNLFRTIGMFSFRASEKVIQTSIIIKQDQQNYSDEFVKRLKDYYLYL